MRDLWNQTVMLQCQNKLLADKVDTQSVAEKAAVQAVQYKKRRG